MKPLIIAVATLVTVVTAGARGADDTFRQYFLGELKTSDGEGRVSATLPIFVEKTSTPSQNRIVERAIQVNADHSVGDYPMYLTVNGSKFTLTDGSHSIHGEGTLVGPAWHWTYFKATFHIPNGMRVEDENFMSDPDAIVARKLIYDRGGRLVQVMDIVVHRIHESLFRGLTDALLHPHH